MNTKGVRLLLLAILSTLGIALATPAMAGEARFQCNDGIDNDKDGWTDGQDADCGGSEGESKNPKQVKDYLAELQAQIDSLQSQVASLTADVVYLEDQISSGVPSDGNNYDALLAGVDRVVVDGVDTLRFTGMNLQIVNGMGSSKDPDAVNGKGNLILGYNESNEQELRGGSHNIVVGPFHSYAGQGGAVFGWDNWIDTDFASITGGKVNMVTGNAKYGSISGGSQNLAEGNYSTINGGQSNHARDGGSTVMGGYGNGAYSIRASVTGGYSITCTKQDGVCGG